MNTESTRRRRVNDRTPIVASLRPTRLHHSCIAVADLEATLEELRSRDVIG